MVGATKACPTPKSFSFIEPCLRAWEQYRSIRQRALKKERLVTNSGASKLLCPSLTNINGNYDILKAFTAHMASSGVILTAHVRYIRDAVDAFYALMEVDVSSAEAKVFCQNTAKDIKRMLAAIKRKWSKNEMPRATQLNSACFPPYGPGREFKDNVHARICHTCQLGQACSGSGAGLKRSISICVARPSAW